MSTWGYISWALWVVFVGAAGLFRSRAYAIFRGIMLAIHTLIFLALLPHFSVLRPLFLALHVLVFFESVRLIRPRLRSTAYRVVLTLPAQYMIAATFMAFPWAIAAAFGVRPWGFQLPYVLGLLGLVQSLSTRKEARALRVGAVEAVDAIVRVRDVATPGAKDQRALSIAQITDPHLGPFMPVQRLKSICQRLVEKKPDLVLLTGDFLTMESQGDAAFLREALSPLAELRGRVFACMGNHDHEAPEIVYDALRDVGATLLIDEAATVETPAGRVQILGLDFHFRDRKARIERACAAHPREPGALRLVLLHDPGAFAHVPPGEADLVLSGHTHGGQVGLVSLGGSFTFAGFIAKIPDHGFWGRGTNRLYVHRGTGHYGFPLRLGVPAEESLLSIQKV